MSQVQPRRSLRANKGTHSKREKEEYYNEEMVAQEEGVEYKRLLKSHSLKKRDEKDEGRQKVGNEDENIGEDGDIGEADENGEIRCTPCGTITENYDEESDPYGDMIECEKCNTWQHISCMGLKMNAVPEHYQCDICSGKPRPLVKKRGSKVVESGPPPKKSKSKSTSTSSSKPNSNSNSNSNASRETGSGDELHKSIESLKNSTRVSTAKAFYNLFKKSFPEKSAGEVSDEEKEKRAIGLALEIEEIIQREFPGKAYVPEGRRILFVLKKQFTPDIICGKLTLEDVVKKTPEEINEDIKRVELQNKENIKNIILVENDHSQIVRRTHKGDIIKENENEENQQMDESIEARAVDHRRFSEVIDTKTKIITNTSRQNAYQNTNPRFRDDFSSDDEHSDIEHLSSDVEQEKNELAEDTNNDDNNNNNTNSNSNNQDDNKNDQDDVVSNILKATDSQSVSEPSPTTRKSTESLSDVDHGMGSPEESKLDAILVGDDEFAQKTKPFELPEIWRGSVTFPEFAHFKAIGRFYSSSDEHDNYNLAKATAKEIMKEHKYIIRGRLERSRCDQYLNEIIATRNLYFVQISPHKNDEVSGSSDNQKLFSNYDRLCNYFIKENKVGVLSGKPEFVKDSYIMPIDFRDVNLNKTIMAHKRESRIGLFAVFVVQKRYEPSHHHTFTHTNNNNERSSNHYVNGTEQENLNFILDQLR
ncbi:BYE1 [Candida oxycetoniae]|uniref:BYE1 n=1 Tax=Candida oxycetoniae TaxID=497107 RepID=A0AAI9SYV2_9ASCO|nr:BYE1 [Candida oxycetoniae]KAI3405188.2 BYE1 [Candida oxycetoniae]